jgi:hypothetical protein
MTSIEIVPATKEMVLAFYGEIPPKTLHAVAGIRDGEVLGVAGVFSVGQGWMMFSDSKPEFMQDKRAIVKAVRAIRKLIAGQKLPVYAVPQEGVKGAEELIEHVGVKKWPT